VVRVEGLGVETLSVERTGRQAERRRRGRKEGRKSELDVFLPSFSMVLALGFRAEKTKGWGSHLPRELLLLMLGSGRA